MSPATRTHSCDSRYRGRRVRRSSSIEEWRAPGTCFLRFTADDDADGLVRPAFADFTYASAIGDPSVGLIVPLVTWPIVFSVRSCTSYPWRGTPRSTSSMPMSFSSGPSAATPSVRPERRTPYRAYCPADTGLVGRSGLVNRMELLAGEQEAHFQTEGVARAEPTGLTLQCVPDHPGVVGRTEDFKARFASVARPGD